MATITTVSNTNLATITPEGTTEVTQGSSFVCHIETDDISEIYVEDNNVDVTSQLTLVQKPTTAETSQTATGWTSGGSYSTGQQYITYPVGYTAENPHTFSTNIYSSRNSSAWTDYSFDFSSIPSNATINSVTIKCCGARENATVDSSHMARINLFSNTTAKGTQQEFTSTSQQTITITDPGTWTRSELQQAKLRFTVGYYGGKLFGITWTVNYSIPGSSEYWYEYTVSNVSSNHIIVVQEPYIPPEEDSGKTYYPITISSINATTDPESGTVRVESGTGQTITIYPSDPLVTLVLDNGVDVSSQLVAHGGGAPSSSMTNTTTQYGFVYCATTGYYTSNNNARASSAAVCRVTFNLPVRCLVTIDYINYAEATYDYGIFGNIDVALTTNSGRDSDAKLVCNTSAYNTSSVQTITYEIEAGSHFIDIKYRKDTYTDSNNDNLQFKISQIQELEPNNYYTYQLSNINTSHSLVFVFGEVTYYFVTSTANGGGKLFPDGQMVQLPGDAYKLTIIPDSSGATVSLTDNGIDVSSSLERKEIETVKAGVTSVTVNYIYRLNNIQTGHTLVASISAGDAIYLKISGAWSEMRAVYKKVGGSWVKQDDLTAVFDNNTIYVKGN